MSTLVIVLLIVTGLILLLLEFFVLPGITVAGVAGTLFVAGGVFVSYRLYGNQGGHLVLLGTLMISGLLLYLSFRTKTWDRLVLNSTIDSKMVNVQEDIIQIGDKGVTVSRLNPMGKARIGHVVCEVTCPGQFIDEGQHIEVIKVSKNQIIVKPINS